MKRKDYIEIKAAVGYDTSHTEETERGVEWGKELNETILMPIEDAKAIVQRYVYGLDYDEAREFVKKYSNKEK